MQKIPRKVESAINAAVHNLYTGSSSQPFSKSLDTIRAWTADHVCDTWHNQDSGETTDRLTIAEQWVDDGDQVEFIDAADTIRSMCGRDLAPYIY